MSESSESPIISRLKEFMSYSQMSNSQFADYTGIPRPTLSQLLHGRNKSINDQLIRKLHDSFPSLNIVWLLFGKGDMLTDSNIDLSAPKSGTNTTPSDIQLPENKLKNSAPDSASPSLFSVVNHIEDLREDKNELRQGAEASVAFENRAKSQFSSRNDQGAEAALAASLQSNQEKKISSIIVLYSDNSFETFLPV